MSRMRAFAAFWILLCLVGSSFAETVIYDGNDMLPFKGRTAQDVTAKYLEARGYEGTYREGASSWYVVPASTKAPYNEGVPTQDTLNTMWAMMNFYRWLTGAKTITEKPSPSESLQYQALDRNFEFDHEISQDSKPDDMPQDLWDKGFELHHSSLAFGYSPKQVISAWMDEGYSPYEQKWADYKHGGGVGHRLSIINPYMTSIEFGYSGNVAINYDHAEHDNNGFEGVFAAFPPPGFMPEDKIYPNRAAWHVHLDTNILYSTENTSVTVTDLTAGTSYTCTSDNGKISPFSGGSLVIFSQPLTPDEDGHYSASYRYTGDYRVRITGLKETQTGNDAEIIYTVSFMYLPPEITSRLDIDAVTGNVVQASLSTSSSAPAKWSLVKGKLPDGMSIANFNDYYYFDGTPTTAGTYSFTLEASNELGKDTADFVITAVNVEPSFVTEELKPASVDVNYSVPLKISGSRPATFTVSNGSLPPGLTLGNDGTITGIPTSAGNYTFTVTASNAGGSASQVFTITARRVKPIIAEYNLVHDTVSVSSDVSYEMKVYAQGSKPITFTLEGGSLPDGLTLNADGTITGKPSRTGKYTFTVRAENDLGYDTKTFTVAAENVRPEIYGQTFGNIKTGNRYELEIFAGGSKPITWSIVAGNFPDGMALSRDKGINGGALISGVPTKTGLFTFTMRAENSAGYDTRELEISVAQGNSTGNTGNTGNGNTGNGNTGNTGNGNTGNGNTGNGNTGNGNTGNGGNTNTGNGKSGGGGGCNISAELAIMAAVLAISLVKKR